MHYQVLMDMTIKNAVISVLQRYWLGEKSGQQVYYAHSITTSDIINNFFFFFKE